MSARRPLPSRLRTGAEGQGLEKMVRQLVVLGALLAALAVGAFGGPGPEAEAPAFETPGWARWNALEFDGSASQRLRLAADSSAAAIGAAGEYVGVMMRVRIDPAATGGHVLLKVGGADHGYALAYDAAAGAMVFALKSAQAHVAAAAFTADGVWRDVEVRHAAGAPAKFYVDGAARSLLWQTGSPGAALVGTSTQPATVFASEGTSPLVGAGLSQQVWGQSAGANGTPGAMAYLRIEREVGIRALEMYFNEGAGAPRNYESNTLAAAVGGPEWTAIAPPEFIRRWPMTTSADLALYGASVRTDEDPNPANPNNTIPVIATAPDGAPALRCRVFGEFGLHSEWKIPAPFPAPPEIFLAFDMYIDSSTLAQGGSPYKNWFHWGRVGEGLEHELAALLGHFDTDLNGEPDVRMHIAFGGAVNTAGRIPFDRWNRVMIRWRSGRDGLGLFALGDESGEFGSHTVSKDDAREFRLRARSDGSPGTVYFRNVAMGGDAEEVMWGHLGVTPFSGCGWLLATSECGVLFQSASGGTFTLEDYGDFGVGDQVWVEGLVDSQCDGCAPATRCIVENTIGAYSSAVGVLRTDGASPCARVVTSDGRTFFVEHTGAFLNGERVFVEGRLAGHPTECGLSNGGFGIEGNEISPGFEQSGVLATGPWGCPMLVTPDGQSRQVERTGGYPIGSRVRVAGRMVQASTVCAPTPLPAVDRNTIEPSGADLNGDRHVNSSDLALLLASWGTASALADLNADGVVNSSDLAFLLSAWVEPPAAR